MDKEERFVTYIASAQIKETFYGIKFYRNALKLISERIKSSVEWNSYEEKIK